MELSKLYDWLETSGVGGGTAFCDFVFSLMEKITSIDPQHSHMKYNFDRRIMAFWLLIMFLLICLLIDAALVDLFSIS